MLMQRHQTVQRITLTRINKKEYQAWKGSHHDMAMRHARPAAELANIKKASLKFSIKQNQFFRKGE